MSLTNSGGPVKRPYQSTLRQAQAATTRQSVIAAAGRRFAEHGYGATSIEDIAAEAGVSRATVFTAVGGKTALIKAAYDVAIVGDDKAISLPDRESSKIVRAEPDPRRYLTGYAGIVTGIGGRVGRIYEALRGAASTDLDVRALWQEIQDGRRVGGRNVVGDVLGKGGLRHGLDPVAAADIVWVLNDPGMYHQFVHQRGWTPDYYQAWLAETLIAQLLPRA
ncbi:MAG: TetR/AcrR family transcriptional regulator [Mycobacteriales bacterium]